MTDRLILGPEFTHGVSLYSNRKCRCDDCRRAWADYCAARKAGRPYEIQRIGNGPRSVGAMRGHPLRRLRKLLEQAIAEREGRVDNAAMDARLPERTLYGIRTGEADEVNFATADKLITNLYGPQKWVRDPVLRAYYENI